MYKFELAKLMYQYSRNTLPSYFSTFFQKVSSIHNRNTSDDRWQKVLGIQLQIYCVVYFRT